MSALRQERSDFAELSTIHGVKLADVSRYRAVRFIWLAIVLVSFAAVCIHCAFVLIGYTTNDHFSKYETVSAQTAGGIPMPLITLCILRRINKTALFESLQLTTPKEQDIRLVEILDGLFFTTYSTAISEPYGNIVEAILKPSSNYSDNETSLNEEETVASDPYRRSIQRMRSLSGSALFEFVRNVSLKCEHMFGIPVELDDKQTRSFCELFRTQLAQNGPCFSLNESIYQRDSESALRIFYVHPSKHVIGSSVNNFVENAIHLYSDVDEALVQRLPVSIQIGRLSRVSISLEEYNFKDSTRGCYSRNQKLLRMFDSYGFRRCHYECMAEEFVRRCKCMPFNTFVRRSVSGTNVWDESIYCNLVQAFECVYADNTSVWQKYEAQIDECRRSKCLLSCSFKSYTPVVTVSPINTEHHVKAREIADEQRKDFTIIEVSFGQLVLTRITEYQGLTLEVLLSEIGGSMGLWTGASLISVLHLLLFLVHHLSEYVQLKRTKIAITSECGNKMSPHSQPIMVGT